MIREGLQMKMNKTTRFILSKLFAIAIIVLGIHLMVAYMAKQLPFGIVTGNIGIWGAWAYLGWLISLLLLGYGALKLFKEVIEAYIRTLD